MSVLPLYLMANGGFYGTNVFSVPGSKVDNKKRKVDKVIISQKEYDDLRANQRLLFALQAAGVDNWQGYEEAIKYYMDSVPAKEKRPHRPSEGRRQSFTQKGR